jgi:hypothetical protein
MLDTSVLVLTEVIRSVRHKIRASPILYMFFIAMIFFSIVMFAFLTFFLLHTNTIVSFMDVFFSVFFLFLMKSAADMHSYFVTSPRVTYTLVAPISHRRAAGEIMVSILAMNGGLWFALSLLYLLVLAGLRVPINYPIEYILFSLDVVCAMLLGCSLALHFFSERSYRVAPTLVLLLFCWYAQSMVFIALMAPLVILQLVWSLSHSLESYRFVRRKERTAERTQVYVRPSLWALFHREVTVIWRERLYSSFVFMSITTALGTGYLYQHGAEIFLPASLQRMIGGFLPSLFVFVGCYVVVMYAAVFPALNLFLSEEKTMWILRNLPMKNETIVYGKTLSLSLCFLTTLPFLGFIPTFLGVKDLWFLAWFLGFSFLAALIIAVPLGVKYVGKKSDILLLYSVAMVLFVLLSITGAGVNLLRHYAGMSIVWLCLLLLMLEVTLVFLSLKLSARLLVQM